MKMKKLFAIALCLVLALTMFTACTSGTKPESGAEGGTEGGAQAKREPIVIGIALNSYANNFCGYIRNGIIYEIGELNKAAGEEYITYMTIDGEFDQALQIERIQTMINKGIDALLVNIIDSGGAQTIIKMCNDAGIPMCTFNSTVNSTDLESYKWAWDVSMDSPACGAAAGDLAAECWKAHPEIDRNGDGVLNALLLTGPITETTALWTQPIIDNAAAAGVTLEVEDHQFVKDYSSAGATDVCTTWVGKYGDKIEIIISITDAMAMGCVEALKANDLIGDSITVPVIGKNCLPEASELIKNGLLYGSILTSPTEIGSTALNIVLNTLDGKEPLDGMDYEWYAENGIERKVKTYAIPVTTDNLDLGLDAYKTYDGE